MKSKRINPRPICEYAKRSIRRCHVNSSKWWRNTIALRRTIVSGARDAFNGSWKSVRRWCLQIILAESPLHVFFFSFSIWSCFSYFACPLAGRATTNEELEEMLEQGNSAVFTQGVSAHNHISNRFRSIRINSNQSELSTEWNRSVLQFDWT